MNEMGADYCREIETYLCRKNEGHLIRIVGPSFELVCGWAERGVPLTVAFRGIDRYVERYYAKGPRRRPVRIDFCEADVLDVFDEWRRAVGVSSPLVGTEPTGDAADEDAHGRRHASLPAHLDRAIARLTALRAGDDRSLDPVLETVVSELDAVRARARGLRGNARSELLARLADLDARLVAAARARLTPEALAGLRREAEAELAPFRARMPREAYEQSLAACSDRLVRERAHLPVLTLE
jgi:hypothetical protein